MYKYPVYQPQMIGNEKKYVVDCLESTWISSKGKYINEFEEKFSEYIGVNYATTVSNGTVAIHLAMEALGIGAGDEVIVPTLTYIASVNGIKYSNAVPVFVDSLENYQMDFRKIEEKISSKTKAIMVVHLYGQMCDMDSIMAIAKKHNLLVIEDCAEAFGSKYKGQYAGTFGDISTFSFFGNKTITTGEGGMVVSNSLEIIEKARHLKGQGLAKNREYWHDIIGYNYRMTNICAAIGLAQLERADEVIAKKRDIAFWYKENLKALPLEVLFEEEGTVNSFWMVTIKLENPNERVALREYLKENGVETRPTFYPIHTMPMYNVGEKYDTAEELGSKGINMPSYPELTHENVLEITGLIRAYYGN